MKFLTPQLTYLLTQRDTRENLRALSKYLIFLAATVTVYSVFFHVLMLREGQEHSWLTGLYWTLTVMSTLGFGDITFHSDVGRLFSILVLLSGIVLLLIVLPFAFIRFFYAPWLEAQLRMRAPREVPKDERDHVIMCGNDVIAPDAGVGSAHAQIVGRFKDLRRDRLPDSGVSVERAFRGPTKAEVKKMLQGSCEALYGPDAS